MATLAEQWMEQGRLEAEQKANEKMQQFLDKIQQATQQAQQATQQAQQATQQAQQATQQAQKMSEKARQVTLKNIYQTMTIRFAVPLNHYASRLQSLELEALEELNELAFAASTQAEFEAALDRF